MLSVSRCLIAVSALIIVVLAYGPLGYAAKPASEGGGDTSVFSPSEEAGQKKPQKPTITYWNVTVSLDVGRTDEAASVRMLVPISDGRQSILSREVPPTSFTFSEEVVGANLFARWDTGRVRKKQGALEYNFTARVTDRWVDIPRTSIADNPPAPDGDASLGASSTIQADAPAVVERARSLTRDAVRVDEITWSLYQYTASFMRNGGTAPEANDALSVLRAEHGNMGGKARLLTALLRASGVPARLVGGLRLQDATRKRSTISWVEAWLGGAWVPFDPTAGHYGWLPADYLALYYGDLPLLAHTAKLEFEYDLLIHQITRKALLAEETEAPASGVTRAREFDWETERVRTFAFYAEDPVASVVLISDEVIQDAVLEQIIADARERAISIVFLSASFESRYFRENYLQRLIANNFGAIAESHLLLVTTQDEAGLHALLQLGEQRAVLRDARIVVAGGFPQAVGRVLGSVLFQLVDPGELVLVNPRAPLLSLWKMARENLVDGRPMAEAASLWDIEPLVIRQGDVDALPTWRRGIVGAWAEAVVAQVPLQAINLILVLPVIACIVVIFRNVIGLETFGTFAPVIVSLSFLITGLTWGLVIFAVIVGLGVIMRSALQWIRIQLVTRLAILIALVSVMMAGLTVGGAYLGIGALLNVSIFPMVIMSNVIENFTTTQVEQGTREALRLTLTTLLVCSACYATIEYTGLQSWILSFPEMLIGVIVLEVVIGKWRGLRLLEYARFYELARRGAENP